MNFFVVSRIQHLILVEPWGFNRKPDVVQSEFAQSRKYKIAQSFTGRFNMFTPVRVAGPLGNNESICTDNGT